MNKNKMRCSALSGDVTDKTKRHNINKQNTTKSERKWQEDRSIVTKAPEAAAAVRVAQAGSTYVVGLALCYAVCRLLPAFVNRGFPTTATPPPLPIPLDATRNGSVAHPIQFRLIVVQNTSYEERSKEIIILYVANLNKKNNQKTKYKNKNERL